MSETKTKNLCTVPAADLNDSQYFIAEDGGELKRIPKAQVVLKKLEKMLATDTENLAGGGEVTAQELLDALAEQVANKLLAKSQVVNNLLATVEGNPLDATQGKALKELIDTTNNNLSNSGIPIVKKITDLYSIKTSGFYYYDAGAMNAPLSSRGGMIIANYLSDSWISLIVVPYASSKIYTNTKYNNTWVGWAESATKDDLPNIFTAQLGTSNLEGNHATTIKGLWNSFPENQVFACNLVDSNNFCVCGYIYGNHKYGAVLYLAFNDCGIVKCNNGTFSDTKL